MRPRDPLPGAADALPDPFQDIPTQRAVPRTDSGTAPALQQPRQASTATSQHTDADRDVVSIIAASGASNSPLVASTSSHGRHSARPTTSDLASVVASQTSLQEHLALAAKSGQELLQRSEALEQQNKALSEYNRQSRKSAVDWCHMAKTYEQDRNLMALRLRELELQLSQAMRENIDHTKLSGKTANRAGSDRGMIDDPSAFNTFVSQSITQILDDVSPKGGKREPNLPRLSKGSYSIQADDVAGQDSSSSDSKLLRSALKNSIANSTTCASDGCQAELKAWKARCEYAENRLTVQELRYEQKSIMMETISAKWAQWRQKVLRQQYQRRLQAAMTPADSRAMSLNTERPQNAEPKKRARFSSTVSDEYRLRMEATQKNTLLNQFNSGYPSGSMDSMQSASMNRHLGAGSAAQPHELLGDTSSDDDGGNRGQHRIHKLRSMDQDGMDEDSPSNQEYGSQPMSLTFPSELAIRRRLYISDPEDEEGDASHGEDQPFTARSARSKTSTFKSVSPTTRAWETRNLKRPTYRGHRSEQQQPEVAATVQATVVKTTRPQMDMPTIESDRSSPPMFESTDYLMANSSRSAPVPHQDQQREQPLGNGPSGLSGPSTSTGNAVSTEVREMAPNQLQSKHPRTPKGAQGVQRDAASRSGEVGNGVGSNTANGTKVTPDQPNRIFVPETPLELQGITPQKKNSQNSQPATIGAATTAPSRRPDQHTANAMVIDLPDEEYQSEAPSFEDEPDKENKVPKRTRGPEALIELDSDEHSREEVLNAEGYQQPHQENGVPLPPPPAQRRPQQQLEPDMSGGAEERVYNYTERRKDKRRQMHGHDCACCRRFYELTGPLPLPDGYNAFFTPVPRPGEKEVWDMTPEERLQQRIQAISRHRVQHEVPLTPPGFWDTTFPPTQEGEEWDRIAEERRQRKKTRIDYLQKEQDQQPQQQEKSRELRQQQQQQQNKSSSSTMRRFGMDQSEDEGQNGSRGGRRNERV